jgi:T3SS negative regulator,GrlR
MLDGLWILQILPPPIASGGIVVFINGKIFGGDSGFSWVGTYRADERLLKARVQVHNFDTDVKSVLGIEGDFDMDISGNIQGDAISGTAMIVNQPQHSLAVRLDKRANL